MQIDWSTLALQLINALILIWILSRFLFKPIAKVISDRQLAAQKIIGEAKALKQSAEVDKAAIASERSALAAEHERVLAASRHDAEEARRTLIASGQAEIDSMRTAAASDLERQRQEASTAISHQATELAIAIARRLVSRLPEAAQVSGFTDGLADAIRALPETTRADLGHTDTSLRLHLPRQITADETQAITKTVTDAIGSPIAIEFVVDPDVIAGLEIETPHMVIRNSLRGDLEKILAEFEHEEANAK